MMYSVWLWLVALLLPFVVCVEHDAVAIKINTIKNIILCKKEHNATRDDYDAMRKPSVPQTRDGKCFMACIFEKFHITKVGQYSTDSFVKAVTELYKEQLQKRERAIQMVKDCGTHLADQWDDSADKCNYSAKVMECIASYSPSVPIIRDILKYQKGLEV